MYSPENVRTLPVRSATLKLTETDDDNGNITRSRQQTGIACVVFFPAVGRARRAASRSAIRISAAIQVDVRSVARCFVLVVRIGGRPHEQKFALAGINCQSAGTLAVAGTASSVWPWGSGEKIGALSIS